MAAPRRSRSGLELLVLGAGPAYSDVPGDLGSAYLVRASGQGAIDAEDGSHGEDKPNAEDAPNAEDGPGGEPGNAAAGELVLDLGQGTFNPLAVSTDPASLAAVAISHLHPDHFIDLIPLRHYLRRPEAQPPGRLRVIAPDGLGQRIDALYDDPGFAAAAFDIESPTLDGSIDVGPFALEAGRVRHSGGSCAYRVSLAPRQGIRPRPGLVYSGDLSDPEDLRPLIRPGDLLLCEATFGPGPVLDGMPHIDAPAAGRLAREAGAGQLVIVHVRMGVDREATLEAARETFGGPTALGRPGDRFDV